MDQSAIKNFLQSFQDKRDRTIAVVDSGNVEKWKESLGWRVGIRELARLAKNFSIGNKFLRRFYYGADYGPKENSKELSPWSRYIFETASMNGFDKKCDLDVEMAIDLVEQRDFYDNLLLFSGDGDLMRAIEYLKKSYGKHCMVMSARGHIGREVLDAKSNGIVEEIIFAEDFEYRLNMDRFVKS
ncbi:MAG: NYN domain-containing protein [Patescibacteria group bacterium]